jgi:hypothetical protein
MRMLWLGPSDNGLIFPSTGFEPRFGFCFQKMVPHFILLQHSNLPSTMYLFDSHIRIPTKMKKNPYYRT